MCNRFLVVVAWYCVIICSTSYSFVNPQYCTILWWLSRHNTYRIAMAKNDVIHLNKLRFMLSVADNHYVIYYLKDGCFWYEVLPSEKWNNVTVLLGNMFYYASQTNCWLLSFLDNTGKKNKSNKSYFTVFLNQ